MKWPPTHDKWQFSCNGLYTIVYVYRMHPYRVRSSRRGRGDTAVRLFDLSLWRIVFSYCSMILRIGTCARSLISSQSLRFSRRGFQYLMILRGLFWRKEWNGYTRWEGTWYRAGSDSVKDCCAFLERVLVSSLSQISENFVPRRYLFSFQNLAQYVCISNAWCWLTMMRSGILDPGT